MKKTILLLIIVVLILCGSVLWNCHKKEYNNAEKKESLITETYSPEQIEWIYSELEVGTIEYADIQARFNIQCLRKTYQGYYAILLQSDGCSVYVFMDDQYKVNRVLVYEAFLSRESFEAQCSVKENMTISEVLAIDTNALPMPTSMPLRTAHIVEEGVMIVTYTYVLDGRLLDEVVIEKIEFIDNETVALHGDDLGLKQVPYILGIDKAKQ